MDLEEPETRIAVWRPAFESLTTALTHARKIRGIARGCMIAIVLIGALAWFLIYGYASDRVLIDDPHVALLATETPPGGYFVLPRAFRDALLLATFLVAAAEFTLAKLYAVLGREQRIVTSLKYFGSAIQEEKAFS